MSGSQKYHPYGRSRPGGDLSTDKLFTGHQIEGDIYYMKARFYNPLAGRFLSADSIVPDPTDPQAFNRYSYVLGNPLRYTDSTGNFVDQEEFARVQGNLSRYGCGYNATFQIICATPSGGSRVHTYTPRTWRPPNHTAAYLRAVRNLGRYACAFDSGGGIRCYRGDAAVAKAMSYVDCTGRWPSCLDDGWNVPSPFETPQGRYLRSELERFASLDCLGLAFDTFAAVAVSGAVGAGITPAGGVALSGAALGFAVSLGIDGYQRDPAGGISGAVAQIVSPTGLTEYAPAKGLARRASRFALGVSLVQCLK